MSNTFSQNLTLRKQLIEVAQRAEDLDLLIYSAGNFSARIPNSDSVLITPSGVPYSDMQPTDIVTIDLYGNKLDGEHEPSSEKVIHTLVYRRDPWVQACAHTESPYVNALYAMNLDVPNVLDNFVYLFAGKGLAVGPAMKSASREFAEATLDAMGDHFGVVWKNHGLFCVGASVETAFRRCWVAEQTARVYHLTLALQRGEPDLIPEEQQQAMVEAARTWGWGKAI